MLKRQRKLPKPLDIQPEELNAYKFRSTISVSEWANQYRTLSSKTTRFHGKWSNDITPFAVEIMDALSQPGIASVMYQGCVQGGAKTEITLNFLAWIMAEAPGPVLMVMPTEQDTKRRVVTRIIPLIESNPLLMSQIGGNLNKINVSGTSTLGATHLHLGWSGSASALADNPCKYVILDEVGKYQPGVRNEADPVSLAKDRVTTYGTESKVYICSTPVLEGDVVDREYRQGDQRQWWAQCQFCNRYQTLEWENVEIERNASREFYEPEDYINGDLARYVCMHCKHKWNESDRWKAVSAGRWLPKDCIFDKYGVVVGDIPETNKRSYRVSSLMLHPAFMSVSRLVAEWIEAYAALKMADKGPMQNFVNSRMAKSWKETIGVTSLERLRKHIGTYQSGRVPEGVQLITCGVDVQKDHVWVSVEGWGYLSEVWTIYEARIDTGDTTNIKNYDVLRHFLGRPWQLEKNPGKVSYIQMTAIDSGHNTDVVYEFARMCSELRIVPIMGSGQTTAVYKAGKILGGTRLRYDLNVLYYKDTLYQLLFENEIPGTGFWHLPKDILESHLKQICAEEKRMPRKGIKKLRWMQKGNVTPDLWDCKVYSFFAGELIGARGLRSVEQIAEYQAKKKAKQVKQKTKKPTKSILDGLPELHL